VSILSAEALVLDVFDLHDDDRIVTFLTREQGKKRGVAKGARRKHSRFAGQLQPLAKVQVTWFEKEGRDLVRISSVELLRPARALQEDLESILLGSYMVDHLLEFAQEGEASETLYRLLDSTIEALLGGVDRDLAARYFEAWVLRLQGIFPPPRECPLCGRPFAAAGGGRAAGAALPAAGDALVCLDCAGAAAGVLGDGPGPRGALPVTAEALELLLRFGRQALPQVARAAPAPAALREVEEVCARVRRHFLQRELRSYDVIRQTRNRL
jgi:DNA repair protein RecO (recombination protein O)